MAASRGSSRARESSSASASGGAGECRAGGGSQGLRGSVDEVRAFDRTLSAGEARALARANGP